MKLDNKSIPEPPFPEQKIGPPPGLEHNMNPRPQFWNAEYKAGMKLLGKTALITGGDSGIGRAVTLYYALEGAKVGIVYLPIEQPDAEETKALVQQVGGQIDLYPCDVKDPDLCQQITSDFARKHGQIDILVNNVASQEHIYELDQLSIDHWEDTFRTNIFSYFFMVKFAVPFMTRGSSIINTGSITAEQGRAGLLDYSSTKGAIESFTRSLARQLISRKIRVNCVVPGPVWTPLNPAERDYEDMRRFGDDSLMGRPAQPYELAPAYVFLASEADSSYMNGEVMVINGGPR